MTTETDFEFDGKQSSNRPNTGKEGIEWQKDAVSNVNQGRMPRICRSCGNTLGIVRFCGHCREPVKWDCRRCWSMYDLTHNHTEGLLLLRQEDL
jgi:hypothetical protein